MAIEEIGKEFGDAQRGLWTPPTEEITDQPDGRIIPHGIPFNVPRETIDEINQIEPIDVEAHDVRHWTVKDPGGLFLQATSLKRPTEDGGDSRTTYGLVIGQVNQYGSVGDPSYLCRADLRMLLGFITHVLKDSDE